MTKEEIIKPFIRNGAVGISPWPSYDYIQETPQRILLLMGQYAEQQAIAFAEWKDYNYINYQMQDGKYYHKRDLLKHISEAKVFTTSELYNIFLNTK